jgi:UDP-N-acetylglucosamine:LPS N-acetylglucosamine transferase
MTKPGYGTILEALALGLPVVYVRRHNFADEAPLVEFLHAFGQGVELSRQDFVSGHWRPALEAAPAAGTSTRRLSTSGAGDAAKVFANYFQ